MLIAVKVDVGKGNPVTVQCDDDKTVMELKRSLAQRMHADVSKIRLVRFGRRYDDRTKLKDANIRNGTILQALYEGPGFGLCCDDHEEHRDSNIENGSTLQPPYAGSRFSPQAPSAGPSDREQVQGLFNVHAPGWVPPTAPFEASRFGWLCDDTGSVMTFQAPYAGPRYVDTGSYMAFRPPYAGPSSPFGDTGSYMAFQAPYAAGPRSYDSYPGGTGSGTNFRAPYCAGPRVRRRW